MNKGTNDDKRNIYLEYIEFPDSIKKNQETYGEIKVNLNKIDTTMKLSVRDRFLFLYVTTEKVEPIIDSIKKVNHKLFADTIGDGTIRFKVAFNNLGDNVLTTVIEDVKMYEHDTIIDRTPINTQYTSISLNVFVED